MKKIMLILAFLMVATQAHAIEEFQKRQRAEHSWAMNVQKIITDTQILLAYNGSNLEYVGFSPMGSATSDDVWLVYYLQYTGNNIISKKSSYGVWDDRASLTYE